MPPARWDVQALARAQYEVDIRCGAEERELLRVDNVRVYDAAAHLVRPLWMRVERRGVLRPVEAHVLGADHLLRARGDEQNSKERYGQVR